MLNKWTTGILLVLELEYLSQIIDLQNFVTDHMESNDHLNFSLSVDVASQKYLEDTVNKYHYNNNKMDVLQICSILAHSKVYVAIWAHSQCMCLPGVEEYVHAHTLPHLGGTYLLYVHFFSIFPYLWK